MEPLFFAFSDEEQRKKKDNIDCITSLSFVTQALCIWLVYIIDIIIRIIMRRCFAVFTECHWIIIIIYWGYEIYVNLLETTILLPQLCFLTFYCPLFQSNSYIRFEGNVVKITLTREWTEID